MRKSTKLSFCCLLMTLVLTGCKDDAIKPVNPKPDKASLFVNMDNAFSYGGAKFPVKWREGDQIGVFTEKTRNHAFDIYIRADISFGEFRGDVEENAAAYYVYTPYDVSATMSGTTLSMKIPDTQIYVDGVAGAGYPMVGVSANNEVQLKNLCGLLGLNIVAERDILVRSITFKTTDGMKVAGDATVNVDSGGKEPVLVMSESATDAIRVNTGERGYAVAKKTSVTFYVALPPQTYAGAEIKIETEGDDETVITVADPLTITRSKISRDVTAVFERLPEPKPTTGTDLNDPTRYNLPAGTDVYSNSYVVDKAGAYFLNASMIGNGSKGIIAKGGFHAEIANIQPVSAVLLWEEAEGTVTDVALSAEGTYLTFNAAIVPGNAVIAVYDGENGTGNILWSWHIWLTETPRDQQYKDAAGANTYLVMDRNLGATFSPASVTVDEVNALTDDQRYKTYGVMYQWGRKDPFVGPTTVTKRNDKVVYGPMAKIQKVEYTATGDEAHNNLLYAIRNPVTFILNQTLGSWNFTPAANLWGNPKGYEATYPKGAKTIYDPCPVGYMIPPANLWAAAQFDQNPIKMKTKSYGRLFNYDGQNMTWYPIVGVRWPDDCVLWDTGTGSGFYWSNSVFDATGKNGSCFVFGTAMADVILFETYGVSHGMNVRCIRE